MKKRPHILRSFWHHIVRHKTFWTLFLFIVYAGFIDPNSFLQRYRLHSSNEARRAHIRDLEESYARYESRLEELGTSQEAIESVARVTLKMKTDNEDLYIIEEEE